MCADANRFFDLMPAFMNLVSAPVLVVLAVALIWSTLGAVILVGLGVMAARLSHYDDPGLISNLPPRLE